MLRLLEDKKKQWIDKASRRLYPTARCIVVSLMTWTYSIKLVFQPIFLVVSCLVPS